MTYCRADVGRITGTTAPTRYNLWITFRSKEESNRVQLLSCFGRQHFRGIGSLFILTT